MAVAVTTTRMRRVWSVVAAVVALAMMVPGAAGFEQEPEEESCFNTVWGRHFLADDKGDVCRWGEIDGATGCCGANALEGSRHSCDTCDPATKCCESYERCVSCCLRPDNDAEGERTATPRARGLGAKTETGHFATAFEHCRGKCRTHAAVTVHENAYVSPKHHCFGRAPPTPSAV